MIQKALKLVLVYLVMLAMVGCPDPDSDEGFFDSLWGSGRIRDIEDVYDTPTEKPEGEATGQGEGFSSTTTRTGGCGSVSIRKALRSIKIKPKALYGDYVKYNEESMLRVYIYSANAKDRGRLVMDPIHLPKDGSVRLTDEQTDVLATGEYDVAVGTDASLDPPVYAGKTTFENGDVVTVPETPTWSNEDFNFLGEYEYKGDMGEAESSETVEPFDAYLDSEGGATSSLTVTVDSDETISRGPTSPVTTGTPSTASEPSGITYNTTWVQPDGTWVKNEQGPYGVKTTYTGGPSGGTRTTVGMPYTPTSKDTVLGATPVQVQLDREIGTAILSGGGVWVMDDHLASEGTGVDFKGGVLTAQAGSDQSAAVYPGKSWDTLIAWNFWNFIDPFDFGSMHTDQAGLLVLCSQVLGFLPPEEEEKCRAVLAPGGAAQPAQ